MKNSCNRIKKVTMNCLSLFLSKSYAHYELSYFINAVNINIINQVKKIFGEK